MTVGELAELRRLLRQGVLPAPLAVGVLLELGEGFGCGARAALRQALAICPGRTHWSRCQSLAAVLARFERDQWPGIARRQIGPCALPATPLERALSEALAAGQCFPRTSRRLFDFLL